MNLPPGSAVIWLLMKTATLYSKHSSFGNNLREWTIIIYLLIFFVAWITFELTFAAGQLAHLSQKNLPETGP